MPRRKIFAYLALALLLVGGGVALVGALYFRWFHPPYKRFGKDIAWAFGMPELAYNFATVVPGKLYRSGLPDARLLDYARRRYGIQHVVSLVGASEVHTTAKNLGMNVTVLNWRTREPVVQDLKMLLELFDGNERVLLHCKVGRDRTGYAIAIFRIRRQHWTLERAIEEMEAHGHSHRIRLETERLLRESLGQMTAQQIGILQRGTG